MGSGFFSTSKRDQANIYALECVVEKALYDYDPKGADDIKHYINRRIHTSNEYAFIMFQKLQLEFITTRTGLARFRKIPQLIDDHFIVGKAPRENHIVSLKNSAKEFGCSIHDLHYDDYPDIKW